MVRAHAERGRIGIFSSGNASLEVETSEGHQKVAKDPGDGRWPLVPESVLRERQRASIVETYRGLDGPERMLFVLAFNGYMASLTMELTLCVKEVEVDQPGWQEDREQEEEGANVTEPGLVQADEQEVDDHAMVHRGVFNKQLLLPSQVATSAGKFSMLLEAFVGAFKKLSDGKKAAVAARMLRQLKQRCECDSRGVLVDGNAQAMQAALEVFSEGEAGRFTEQEEKWIEYWWMVMSDE